MGDARGRLRPRVFGLLVAEIVVVATLHHLGRHRWMRVDTGDLGGWLAEAPAEDVVLASVRLVALVLAWWMLLSTLVVLVAGLAGAPAALRSVRWALVPGTRRLLDAALAVSLSSGPVMATGALPVSASEAVVAVDSSPSSPSSSSAADPGSDPAACRMAIHQAATPLAPVAPGARTCTVAGGDTLWELAATHLGDARRWVEIRDLNQDRVAVAAPGELRVGWVLELPPAPAPADVVVQPGDSLWSIAEDSLAAGWHRAPTDAEVAPYWTTVVATNQPRLLPPHDPDLIHPGQVLVVPALPADPTAPTPAPPPAEPAPPPEAGAAPIDPEPEPEPAPAPESPPPPAESDADAEAAPETTAPPVESESEALPPEVAETTAPPTESDAETLPPEVTETTVPPVESEAEVLPPEVTETTAPPVESDAEVVPEADEVPPEVTLPEAEGTTVPEATVPTEAPVTPVPDEPPATDDDATADEAGDQAGAPAAAWVFGGGVGVAAGLVLGLERRRRARQRWRARGERIAAPGAELAAAEVRLRAGDDGDRARLVEAALRAGSAGLAGLRWAEVTGDEVVLVLDRPALPPAGFSTDDGADRWRTAVPLPELVELGEWAAVPVPLLVTVGRTADGDEVLVDLEARGVVPVDGDPVRVRNWLQALALAAATVPWSGPPRVVTVGLGDEVRGLPGVEEVATLEEALVVARSHAARVDGLLASLAVADTVEARARGVAPDAWEPLLVLSAVPPGGDETDLHVPADHAAAVVLPRGAAGPTGPGCHIDAAGFLRMDGVDPVVRAVRLDGADLAAARLLDHAENAQNAAATDTDAEIDEDSASATAVDGPAPRRAGAGLDDLLAGVDVLVRVLGDVGAVWLAPDGIDRPVAVGRQKGLEALCYLAVREATVDRAELEAALFPTGPQSLKTFQDAMAAAREAVTDELFPAPAGGRYALSDRVATDYGLFADLVRQADATREAEAAAALLTEALGLVAGEPFGGAGRGFAWVGTHRETIVSHVVDAADELAEIRLEHGDWHGAEWAARQGLAAFPCDERLFRILMRCAREAGDLPGVQRVYEEACRAIADPDGGAEPHDTVHPETVELLEELLRGAGRVTA